MLLVLAILMTVVVIAIPSYQNYAIKKEEQRFFELLQQDIYFAQSQSYSLKQTAQVIFRENKESYEVFTDVQAIALSRKMPATVYLKKNSNISGVYFSSVGTIIYSGTLRFATSGKERTITVYLGGGRVVFSE